MEFEWTPQIGKPSLAARRPYHGDQNLPPDMVLGNAPENVILLITDLQPDVDKKRVEHLVTTVS